MNFNGRAARLVDTDLPRIGAMIDVGEDEIHAFLDVETRGGGFDSRGRPKMLFEPHVFYRELAGAERDAAVKAGLAYPRWKRNYPADSYPRLEQAMAINREAALRSASWGIGQVMGFNCKLAGYDTAAEMVTAFLDSESAQLESAVEFIISNRLDDDLRNHDWRGFARGYNGAGYEANGYHTKLAAAYAKWAKIADTPWEPSELSTVQTIHTRPPNDLDGPPAGIWAAILNFLKGLKR